MNAQWIQLHAPDGERYAGYLSLPPRGRGPGLLLIQEIFGVNEHIRAVADQYAGDGFTVLAPDVFFRQAARVDLGYGGEDFTRGIEYMKRVDFAQTVRDLGGALKTLRQRPECTGTAAVLGYCMGGRLAFHVAADTDVDAAVCYYGGGIDTVLDQASKIRCPITLHFAEKDHFIPLSAVQAAREAFADRADVMIECYQGVDHGFNCWARDSYDQRAAALARGRTLAFLATNLP